MKKNKIIDIFQINTNDRLSLEKILSNKYNNKKLIYDYINNPEYITVIENDEIKEEKYFLSLEESDLKYPIYDNLGQELNIVLSSDIFKLKAEYVLYKDLIDKYETQGKYDIASNYRLYFLSKWYK